VLVNHFCLVPSTEVISGNSKKPNQFGFIARFPRIHQLLLRGGKREFPPLDVDGRMLAKVMYPDYVSRLWLENRHDWARRYLEAWRTGIKVRKPFPGFHPGIYRDHHPKLQGDPTIAFLKAGRPEGPWMREVIGERELKVKCVKVAKQNPEIRAALHMHLYYPEQAEKLVGSFSKGHHKPDLFVSVTSGNGRMMAKKLLQKYGVKYQGLEVFTNRGRDLGPFLTGFRDELLKYEIVGHFHIKGSKHAPPDFVKRWNGFLFGNLVGRRGQMMDVILEKMASDSGIGIVYPDDPLIWGWFENYSMGKELLEKLGLVVPKESTFFNYPAGSMFWARTAALKPLFDLGIRWEDYPEEPISQDATILHSIERLFGIIPEQIGYRTLLTHVPGLIR
jgi:Rhamnan synthesis protein F